MYDCTRSRDAINHYLPKFPEYCPAYRSLLALFQTFQYPRPFGGAGEGRSSANSLSLFRTHRRPTAARKCESKCRRKKENALLFNPRNIASGGEGERTSIRTDNRSFILFDFYYRYSVSVPRGNHIPPPPDSIPYLFLSSIFHPDD